MNTPKQSSTYRFIKNNATQKDTIKTMDNEALVATGNDEIRRIANELLQTEEPLRSLLHFAFDSAYFFPDDPENQVVRSPMAMLREKTANCVDYATFISSILRLWNVPHSFKRIFINTPQGQLTHIYVVTDNGISIDPVLNQDQYGKEIFVRGNKKPIFNFEFPHRRSKKTKVKHMKLYTMQGMYAAQGVRLGDVQGYQQDAELLWNYYQQAQKAGDPAAMQGIIDFFSGIVKGIVKAPKKIKEAIQRFKANKGIRQAARELKAANAEALKAGYDAPFADFNLADNAVDVAEQHSRSKRMQNALWITGGSIAGLLAVWGIVSVAKQKK